MQRKHAKSRMVVVAFILLGLLLTVASYALFMSSDTTTPVISSLTSDVASPQSLPVTVTFTCNASDPDDSTLLYRFWIYNLGELAGWVMVQDWGSSGTFVWTPSEVGSYQFVCWVRDGKHANTSEYDAWAYWNSGALFQITQSTQIVVVPVYGFEARWSPSYRSMIAGTEVAANVMSGCLLAVKRIGAHD